MRRFWLGLGLAVLVVAGGRAQEPPDDLGLDDLLGDLTGSSQGAARAGGLSVRGGKVGATGFWFPEERGGRGRDQRLLLSSELEIESRWGGAWSAYLRPRFQIDPADTEQRRTRPFEGYLQWSDKRWELRAGILLENWGIADTSNPLDILPRRDFASDFLEADRLGETGFRARWFLPDAGRFGEPTLSFYVMPDLRSVPAPTRASRLAESGAPGVLGAAGLPEGSDEVLYGFRGQATWNTPAFQSDVQVIVARGPERFPGLLFGPGAGVTAVAYGARTFGLGIRAVPNAAVMGRGAAEYTWKLELAVKDTYALPGAPGPSPESYVAYTVGFDHPRTGVLRSKDQLTFMIEYAGEFGTADLNHELRLFTDDLVVRWAWEANDFARTRAELRAIYDLGRKEAILQAVYGRQLRRWHEDLRFEIDVRRALPSGSPPSFLGGIPDPSGIRVALSYEF